MNQLRKSGTKTKLVGLTTGLLVGAKGLTVKPDITLADLQLRQGYPMIIVPGYAKNARSLLADPRVHQLFAAAAETGGRVAVMSEAEAAFVESGLLDSMPNTNIEVQGGQETAAFILSLIHLISD